MNNVLAAGVSMSLIFSPAISTQATYSAPIETPQVQIVSEPSYSAEDLYWLSRLVYAEAGSENCSDELQRAVASVAVNRTKHILYADTIKGVIFEKQAGRLQYGCTRNGMIYLEPDERAIKNATYVLEYGSTLPEDVLAQCDRIVWGNHYKTINGVKFSRYGG